MDRHGVVISARYGLPSRVGERGPGLGEGVLLSRGPFLIVFSRGGA